jgi:hypothetical protein
MPEAFDVGASRGLGTCGAGVRDCLLGGPRLRRIRCRLRTDNHAEDNASNEKRM